MAERERTVAILFADVCGSTPLYEDTGNWEALSLIGRALDAHATIVQEAGGVVIRSKGDDLLCTFDDPDSAVEAAGRMLDAQREGEVQLRVGLHYGAVIQARGDIFGDAVNVAARLMSVAMPDECIVSEQLKSMLDDATDVDLQHFDEQTIKGKAEAIDLFRMLRPDDEDVTVMFPKSDGSSSSAVQSVYIVLRMGEHTVRCDDEHPDVSIGRGKAADLYTPDRRVSRIHAVISVRDGRVELKDQSTHGTWVRAQDSEFRLRREAVRLVGTGVLWLGASPGVTDAVRVEFDVSS